MRITTDQPKAAASLPIHQDLRQRIITVDLPPGAVLNPKELAEHYRVSPTPVREALILLQQEGFVRMYPQARTVVAPIRLSQLHEVHFLRMAIESEVTRSLAADCPSDVLARARTVLRLQEIAAASGRQDKFRHYGDLFHQTLFGALGRNDLHLMLRGKSGHIERIERLGEQNGPEDAVLEAHDAILAAIARQDGDRAVASMRNHLNPVVGQIDSLQSRHPAYFLP